MDLSLAKCHSQLCKLTVLAIIHTSAWYFRAIGCSERRLIGHSFYRLNFLQKSCATCREKCRRVAPRIEKSDKNCTMNTVYICTIYNIYKGSQDSVVGIATGYRLDDRGLGVRVLVGSRIFSMSSRPAVGSTQSHIQWVPGLFPRG
jgi:hypothetical protein